MAGHSKFKNIMHRKGAQDKKRAKIFNRLAREITVAVKEGGGEDPGMNPRLRLALQNARADNMPKDKIENAIKKGAGNSGGADLESIRYEGYGPGGVAIIVEVMTDNTNRSVADIRTIFSKNGGTMGDSGSVSFMFDRVGVITYPLDAGDEEVMFEAAVEAGAENCESDEEGHNIICMLDDFGTVREGLEKSLGEAKSAKLVWQPKSGTPVGADKAETLLKLMEALEDYDDVQEVASNFDIDEDVLQQLSA